MFCNTLLFLLVNLFFVGIKSGSEPELTSETRYPESKAILPDAQIQQAEDGGNDEPTSENSPGGEQTESSINPDTLQGGNQPETATGGQSETAKEGEPETSIGGQSTSSTEEELLPGAGEDTPEQEEMVANLTGSSD